MDCGWTERKKQDDESAPDESWRSDLTKPLSDLACID